MRVRLTDVRHVSDPLRSLPGVYTLRLPCIPISFSEELNAVGPQPSEISKVEYPSRRTNTRPSRDMSSTATNMSPQVKRGRSVTRSSKQHGPLRNLSIIAVSMGSMAVDLRLK